MLTVTRHGTTTANAVATVALPASYDEVEVLSRDGADALWFTLDGTAPTVGGDDVHVLPGVASLSLPVGRRRPALVVKLLSTAAVAYTVIGRNRPGG